MVKMELHHQQSRCKLVFEQMSTVSCYFHTSFQRLYPWLIILPTIQTCSVHIREEIRVQVFGISQLKALNKSKALCKYRGVKGIQFKCPEKIPLGFPLSPSSWIVGWNPMTLNLLKCQQVVQTRRGRSQWNQAQSLRLSSSHCTHQTIFH